MRGGGRTWLGVLAMALALVAAPGARGETLRVLLDGAWAPHHAPFFLATERGYFAQARIDALVEPSLGGNTVTVMVGQRAFDLGQVPASTAAAAISRGAPIRVVAVYQPRSALAVVGIAGKVALDGPKSLVGMRLGVTPGGTDSLGLGIFRRVNNLGLSALLVMPTEPSAKLPALTGGRVDAVVGNAPVLSAGLRAEGLEPLVLMLGEHGVPLMGLGFVAPQGELTAKADLLRRGLEAIRRGFAAAAAAPQEACAVMQRSVTMTETEAQCTALLTAFLTTTMPADAKGWGRQSPEDWVKMIEAMRAAGEIQGTRPSSFYHSNAVLP
jgi:NitT/TauT family transport system substrate-binding protein